MTFSPMPTTLEAARAEILSWREQHKQAAAELRRLHMENEDLKNACKIYNDALKEEKALNAQLLEALETCGEDEWYTDDDYGMVQTYDEDKVRAAIAAAKEMK
jgi:chromosome segregation ATPase